MAKKIKTKPKAKKTKTNTKVKPKIKKSNAKVKAKTGKQAKLKKPMRNKNKNLGIIDIGKMMHKYAYVEIAGTDKKMIKKYLNIAPSAVKEYISRIKDATEMNMRLIAETVYLKHDRKTIMVKQYKDKDDIDDITDHFGNIHMKVVNGDKEELIE